MSDKTIELSGEIQPNWLHMPKFLSERVVIEPESGIGGHHIDALRLGRAAVMASEEKIVMETGTVMIDPIKTVERRRSAHEVGFGAFLSRNRHDSKGRPVKLAVAIKPFSRPEKALHEVSGYLTLAELGIETFQPIGVFPSKHANHFVVVTKKRNDLTSLDRDRWVIGRQVVDDATAETALRNNETVKDIARLIGYIHSNGVFHPDGQIKNYAKTPKGTIGIIDTENLIVSELNDINSVENAWYDIEKLVKSLIISTQDKEDADLFGVGMLYGLSINNLRNSIEELIIVPYLESLYEQMDGASLSKQDHIAAIYDGISARFMEESSWPDHFIKVSRAS